MSLAADTAWPRADAHIHLFGEADEAPGGIIMDNPARYEVAKMDEPVE